MSFGAINSLQFGSSADAAFSLRNASRQEGAGNKEAASQQVEQPENATGEPQEKRRGLTVSMSALLHSVSRDYTSTPAGTLQQALLESFSENPISNLFAGEPGQESEYLKAQLNGLKLQNEFATNLSGILTNAIMSARAGKSPDYIKRQIEDAQRRVGGEKIHEEAERDFEEAEEEMEEKIEEEASEESGAVQDEGDPESVKEAIEKKSEEASDAEDQTESEPESVPEAIEKESARASGGEEPADAGQQDATVEKTGGASAAEAQKDPVSMDAAASVLNPESGLQETLAAAVSQSGSSAFSGKNVKGATLNIVV